MSNYFVSKNNNNEFVISDTYPNLALEEVVNLGSLGSYRVDNEYDGGVCSMGAYYNNNGTVYKYPFFCCLGTKRNNKICVLYNSSNVARPVVINNSYTGICRSYTEGTRASYSITLTGAITRTLSWSAGNTNMYNLYFDCLYPDDFGMHVPLESHPKCMGTAIQPIAIISDESSTGANLKYYYAFIFGVSKKTTPSPKEAALCCYDGSKNLIFSSINHPLEIKEFITGDAPYTCGLTYKANKIGIIGHMYNSQAMPILTQTSFGLMNNYFYTPSFNKYNSANTWLCIYQDTLNNRYFNGSNKFSYSIIDLQCICNYYGL